MFVFAEQEQTQLNLSGTASSHYSARRHLVQML